MIAQHGAGGLRQVLDRERSRGKLIRTVRESMTKYTQSDEELWDNLRMQGEFLRASSASFDNGHQGEAQRLAVTIRVLVHDTANSQSLLGLLVIKDSIEFHDTAYPLDPANIMPHQGLVRMNIQVGPGSAVALTIIGSQPKASTSSSSGVSFVARATGNPDPAGPLRLVLFEEWWNEVVIKTLGGKTFTRKDLILTLANKEGGAHVDPKLNESYANLTRFNGQGWKVIADGESIPPANSVVAASVRQIAHEVLESLQPHLEQ